MEETVNKPNSYTFSIDLLPKETLLGIHTVDCEVDLNQDGVLHNMKGIQFGLIFLTINCMKIY